MNTYFVPRVAKLIDLLAGISTCSSSEDSALFSSSYESSLDCSLKKSALCPVAHTHAQKSVRLEMAAAWIEMRSLHATTNASSTLRVSLSY